VRRRRVIASVLVLCAIGGGLAALLSNLGNHTVFVKVGSARTTGLGSDSNQHEYPAAPGAASLKSVKEALKASERVSGGPASNAPDTVLSADAKSSFSQLASSLPGHVELALLPLGSGEAVALGGDQAAHGWSTTKVPVLVALMRASNGLTGEEQDLARSAITASDNQSILSLFGHLQRLAGGLGGASHYVEQELRASGDSETVIATAPPPPGAATTFGQTLWRPSEAVRFFRALADDCLLPPSQTSYVLRLMKNIEASESWGLGSAGLGSVAFKGGWGPESNGYLVRQSGIVDPGSPAGVAVALVAFAPSFSAGTEIITRTASWLKSHLTLSQRATMGCTSEKAP
jgi:beta-lactamase class A